MTAAKLNQADIAKHREYLEGMFARRYPGAKMVWVKPLKQVDTFLLVGRVAGSGKGWRGRELQATTYLPRSWREGPAYSFA